MVVGLARIVMQNPFLLVVHESACIRPDSPIYCDIARVISLRIFIIIARNLYPGHTEIWTVRLQAHLQRHNSTRRRVELSCVAINGP